MNRFTEELKPGVNELSRRICILAVAQLHLTVLRQNRLFFLFSRITRGLRTLVIGDNFFKLFLSGQYHILEFFALL